MIFGIGVDVVEIARIEAALGRFGDRFARRILTDSELERFRRSKRKAEMLAKHFAAKEATTKALGTGLSMGVSWRDIEVRSDPRGRPYLVCCGRVEDLFREFGVGRSHLSLCDEAKYAVANVVLERPRREDDL